MNTQELLDAGCCPWCGDEELKVKRYNEDSIIVKHKNSDGCSFQSWPIYDPTPYDDDVNQRGLGLSICQTCLSWAQHLQPDDDGNPQVVEPNRDENGDVLCSHCERRLRQKT